MEGILDPVSGVSSYHQWKLRKCCTERKLLLFARKSNHGLNVVDVQGFDAAGNVAGQAIGYYYSTAYQTFEEKTIDEVKVDEAMKVFLGKEVIDDGDHDANIDDLATLIEVVLTQADLGALLGASIDPIIIPDVICEPTESKRNHICWGCRDLGGCHETNVSSGPD